VRAPRALRRYVASALSGSLDEIGLALAPRLEQAEEPAGAAEAGVALATGGA
jgi:hypothetical protein